MELIVLAALQAFSIQMHVHGSLSEGNASWLSSTLAAQEAGVDVLWWSEHDYGILRYNIPTTFSFDALSEPDWHNESWMPSPNQVNKQKYFEVTGSHSFSEEVVYEGTRSMYLDGTAAYGEDRIAAGAKSIIGNTVLRVAVIPEDAMEIVITLSHHPIERIQLRYFLSNSAERRVSGNTHYIPVPYRKGVWNVVELPITADAPDEDNSITGIQFVGKGYLDGMAILFDTEYPDTYERQGEMLAKLPLTQHQGVEYAGFGEHMNEFTLDEHNVRRAPSAADAVSDAHARGSLISLNHMFGVGTTLNETKEELLADLIAKEVYGVDLLEVGYRNRGGASLEDFLWVWDELWRAGFKVIGTGVSDTHDWRPGFTPPQNPFVSWVWAESDSKADLSEGLRSGRVFFGDIALFNGTLDIVSDSGHMGQTVRDNQARLVVTGLRPDDQIHYIRDGVTERVAAAAARRPPLVGGGCHRVAVYSANGEAKVFSNPICLSD